MANKADISNNYSIDIIQGNHGLWIFVKRNEQLIFEQSGFSKLQDALDFIREVIYKDESLNHVEHLDFGN